MSSLSHAVVVQIGEIYPHDNADSLELTECEGFTVVLKKGSFKKNDLAIWVPPDLIVSSEPEFAFLGAGKRIKGIKLRGVFSAGLIVPARPHHTLGEDVTEELGLTKYDPEIAREKGCMSGEWAADPAGAVKYTDIDSLRKYHRLLIEGEPVVIMEKLDGSNARYLHNGTSLHVATRNHWLKEDEKSIWWLVAKQYGIAEQLSKFPNLQFFGEVYGVVNKLRYGHDASRRYSFRVFDIFDISLGRYVDWERLKDIVQQTEFELAPVIYEGPWLGFDAHYELAQKKSELADHGGEGIVIRPTLERRDKRLGRVILKLHSEYFLAL